MNGKGDRRRPQQVSDESLAHNWDRIFGFHPSDRAIYVFGNNPEVVDAVRAMGYDPTVWDDAEGNPWAFADTRPRAVCGVAKSPRHRKHALGRLEELGVTGYKTVVHPRAIVSPSAMICPGAIVLAGAYVGPRATVRGQAVVMPRAVVGHDCSVGFGAIVVAGAVMLGRSTLESWGWLCANSVLLPDATLKRWKIAAAGKVYRGEVKDE